MPAKTETCRRYAENVRPRLERVVKALIGSFRACAARPTGPFHTFHQSNVSNIAFLQGVTQDRTEMRPCEYNCVGHKKSLLVDAVRCRTAVITLIVVLAGTRFSVGHDDAVQVGDLQDSVSAATTHAFVLQSSQQ